MDPTSYSSAILSDVRENSLPSTVSTTFDEALERIRFLNDTIIIEIADLIRLTLEQQVLSFTETDHTFLIDILRWTQRFNCFILHSACSSDSTSLAFSTASSEIANFQAKIQRATSLQLSPKIRLRREIFKDPIKRIQDKIRNLYTYVLNTLKLPSNPQEAQSMIDIIYNTLSLECPLIHIKGSAIRQNKTYLQQSSTLHFRLSHLLHIKANSL